MWRTLIEYSCLIFCGSCLKLFKVESQKLFFTNLKKDVFEPKLRIHPLTLFSATNFSREASTLPSQAQISQPLKHQLSELTSEFFFIKKIGAKTLKVKVGDSLTSVAWTTMMRPCNIFLIRNVLAYVTSVALTTMMTSANIQPSLNKSWWVQRLLWIDFYCLLYRHPKQVWIECRLGRKPYHEPEINSPILTVRNKGF